MISSNRKHNFIDYWIFKMLSFHWIIMLLMQYFLFGELIWKHGLDFLGSIIGYFSIILYLLFTLEIIFIIFGGYLEFLLVKYFFLSSIVFFDDHLSIFYFLTLFQILVYDNISPITSNCSKKNSAIIIGSVLISGTAYLLYSSNTAKLQFQLLSIYPVTYLFLVYVSYIRVSNRFPAPESILQKIAYSFRNFRNSFLLVTISIIYFVFRTKSLTYGSLGLIVLFVIIGAGLEWSQFQNSFKAKSPEKKSAYYMYIIFIFMALYTAWLELFHGAELEYKETASNLNEVFVSFSIFNLASAFILLQSNYQKFSSNYLVGKIIRSPVLIISISVPLLILFTQVNIYKNGHLDGYFSSLLVLINVVCTLVLLFYFKFILDVNYQLNKLLKNINKEDIELYKKNVIYLSESKIDSVLHVITSIISKNDAISSHSVFYNLAVWVSRNIRNINKQGNDANRDQNKFYDFFEIIINNIIILDSNVIHLNFIESIKNMILNSVDSNNFEEYGILYDSLYLYLERMIERRKDELSVVILRTILFNIDKVFMNLPKMDADSIFFNESDEFRKFEEVYINKYEHVIQKAIENGCKMYLERTSLYDKIYLGSYDSSELQSDGKITNLLIKTRHSAIRKYEYLIQNSSFWHHFSWEFGVFLPYKTFGGTFSKFNKSKIVQNVLLDTLMHIYINSIENERIKSDMDYNIFYRQIFSAVDAKDLEIFQIYLNSFTFLINFQFNKELKKENPNHGILKSIWMRMVQVKESVNKVGPGLIFEKKISSKIKYLKKRYKKITEYEVNNVPFQYLKDVDLLNEYDIEKKPNENKRS